MSNRISLVERLRNEYARTGAYAPEATCRHGIHPYDCREGCAPPVFEAADEIERLNAACTMYAQEASDARAWAERLRAALEKIANGKSHNAYARRICQKALAPSPKPMMSADGGEDIPLSKPLEESGPPDPPTRY